jgi:hypothetical protein
LRDSSDEFEQDWSREASTKRAKKMLAIAEKRRKKAMELLREDVNLLRIP